MQKGRYIYQEKGSIAIYAIATILCFVIILSGIFSNSATVRKNQLKTLLKIKEIYSKQLQKADLMLENRDIVDISGYEQEGLIAFYDAINNTGRGHSNNTTIWKDLSGNGYDAIYKGTQVLTWNEKSYDFINPNTNYFETENSITLGTTSRTIEIVCSLEEDGVENIIGLGTTTSGTLNDIIYYQNGLNLNDYSNSSMEGITDEWKLGKNYSNTIIYNFEGNTISYYTDTSIKDNVSFSNLNTSSSTLNIGIGKDTTHNTNKRFKVYSVRIYNRVLTTQERQRNYELDKQRYEIDSKIITAKTIANAKDKTNYYGKVVDYIVENEETQRALTQEGITWKIFYIGDEFSTNKSSQIYLIASNYVPITCLPKTKGNTGHNLVTSGNYNAYWGTSSSDTSIINDYLDTTKEPNGLIIDSIVGFLNRDYWEKYSLSTDNNMKAVAYMLDTQAWNTLYNGTNSEYAVGGPSIEMLVKSYSQTHGTNTNGIDQYQARATENGYEISDDNGSTWDYHSIGMMSNQDSLYINANTSNDTKGYWLSSPSTTSGNHMMGANYSGTVSNYYFYNNSDREFRPIVCLKSDVQLEEIIKDGVTQYKIK